MATGCHAGCSVRCPQRIGFHRYVHTNGNRLRTARPYTGGEARKSRPGGPLIILYCSGDESVYRSHMSTTTSDASVAPRARPFAAEETARIKAHFFRDGFCFIPGVLERDEITALRQAVDHVFEGLKSKDSNKLYGSYVAVRLFEDDPVFEAILTREPIITLVEEILGKNCHLIAQNVVRNAPGQAIDAFHADELVFFPVSEGMERHDPRLRMPVFLVTVQIPLTDIPSIEYGPTEFVPGSHYSGRNPNDPKNPIFQGQGPVPIFCKAGDIYLHNGQCWHRGAPNSSNQMRYLLQLAYGMRFVSQRFYPFVNYQLPQRVYDRADERRKRVLGFHPKGPYG